MATAIKLASLSTATPMFAENHFSPSELGELWGLSADSIRRLFLREPGVLVISEGSARGKRRYRTPRIPAAVAERVHRRLAVVVNL
jgi:hypothetical protein